MLIATIVNILIRLLFFRFLNIRY